VLASAASNPAPIKRLFIQLSAQSCHLKPERETPVTDLRRGQEARCSMRTI
jgi:hypothetical protein